jgi:YVTN family beta-propeller protein
VYVANSVSNDVSVLGPKPTTVTDKNAFGPVAIVVNSQTNRIYTANFSESGRGVTVIDGSGNTVFDSISLNVKGQLAAVHPTAIALNQTTNKIYVANQESNTISVIDGATDDFINILDSSAVAPVALAVNATTNKIYVANSNSVTVMDGTDNSTTNISDLNQFPKAVAVNPQTNKIYVADGPGVLVINGATNATSRVTNSKGTGTNAVAINTTTNMIYVTNGTSNNVTVIDGSNDTVAATIP